MRRLVIVGNAGSGKSTLARALGARLAIPVVSLDALAWEPGWQAVSTATLRARPSAAIAGEAWGTDGNYAQVSFDLRLPRTDLFIWVERPVWACAARVLSRAEDRGRPSAARAGSSCHALARRCRDRRISGIVLTEARA